MIVPRHFFRFESCWKLPGDVATVYGVFSRPERYPDWWLPGKLAVTEIEKGDDSGVGREVECRMRGCLPLTFCWRLKCIRAVRPKEITAVAYGDFTGQGTWSFEQTAGGVDARFNWQVETLKLDRGWFRGVLTPLLNWNHDWVMRQGEKGLRRYLSRNLGDGSP